MTRGVLVPLFSLPSRRSWGIGELPDLVPFARWMSAAAVDLVLLLPLNEMDHAHNSPYAALSAMAIDPLFVALDDVCEFQAGGGEAALPRDAREALAAARAAPRIDYAAVRTAKTAALELAFETLDGSGVASQERGEALDAFRSRNMWWLDDHAMFRALHDENGGVYWREWDRAIRDRDGDALAAVRSRLAGRITYHAYVQFLADEQWRRTRAESGVRVLGDFPFMVSGHSADVWSRQREFALDASVGAPPDASSPEGQDWGLPAYRWDVCESTGYEWLAHRSRRCTELFDGFRVDHVVGFYRTFVRDRDGTAAFVPPAEAEQVCQGERVVRLLARSGCRVIAEDLGTVPDFVRDSLRRLGIPGLKVLRWEREWDVPGQPFRDPSEYPRTSVATTGTHDTETLAEWWSGSSAEERRKCAELPSMRAAGLNGGAEFSPAVRDALLRGLTSARSELLILPVQDIFGWPDRINDPAAEAGNWTWRMPWPADEMLAAEPAVERAAFLRSLSVP